MADYSWLSYPVTHGYIPSYDPTQADTPHWADDIATPFHSNITALLSGTVIQSDYAGWGGEVFIQPDSTSYPEYYVYHLDQLNVLPGQHVNAGDLLGLSGGENPGYPGALHPASPEWSTGPHTHVGFFSQYTQTPVGSRPEGPDITPLLQAIKTGKINPAIASIGPTTPISGSSNNTTSSGSSLPILPDLAGGFQQIMIRAGLFLVVLMFFGFGLYIAFKPQIDQAASKGMEAAKTAAEVAAV